MTENKRTVRWATPDDLDVVLELDRVASVGHERSAFLTARVQSGDVVLYEQDARVLGYAVSRARAFFGRDFVDLLAVAPDNRRQGIGSFLLQRTAEMSSTDRVFTSTNRSNAQMIGLLEKARWQFSGALEGIDEDDPELVYFTDVS